MDVSLNKVYKAFDHADKNKDGKLSKQEIAAESLYQNEQGNNDVAGALATFVVGGKDQNGLFPDQVGADGKYGNPDGFISLGDIAKLAEADFDEAGGSVDSISTKDFEKAFGADKINPEGSTVDTNKLRQIANGSSTGTVGGTDVSAQFQKLLRSLLQIITLFSSFGGMGGLGGNSFTNPYQTQPFSRQSLSPIFNLFRGVGG